MRLLVLGARQDAPRHPEPEASAPSLCGRPASSGIKKDARTGRLRPRGWLDYLRGRRERCIPLTLYTRRSCIFQPTLLSEPPDRRRIASQGVRDRVRADAVGRSQIPHDSCQCHPHGAPLFCRTAAIQAGAEGVEGHAGCGGDGGTRLGWGVPWPSLLALLPSPPSLWGARPAVTMPGTVLHEGVGYRVDPDRREAPGPSGGVFAESACATPVGVLAIVIPDVALVLFA